MNLRLPGRHNAHAGYQNAAIGERNAQGIAQVGPDLVKCLQNLQFIGDRGRWPRDDCGRPAWYGRPRGNLDRRGARPRAVSDKRFRESCWSL